MIDRAPEETRAFAETTINAFYDSITEEEQREVEAALEQVVNVNARSIFERRSSSGEGSIVPRALPMSPPSATANAIHSSVRSCRLPQATQSLNGFRLSKMQYPKSSGMTPSTLCPRASICEAR